MKWIQSLEPRRLLAVTPATVLTAANRQTLLNDLNISIKSQLQADLTAGDTSAYDAALLSYMVGRANSHFFFNPSDAAAIASYITSNIGAGSSITNGDAVVAHKFPASSDSHTYTVQQGATIDWVTASSNPETLHALNRMEFWQDLSQAYRYSGDTKYVTEMVSELAGWSKAYPTMTPPSSWSKTDLRSWVLDMGIRTEYTTAAYFQVLGSGAWSKEANTLFLFKIDQQGQYLSTADSYGYADNRSVDQAKGLIYMGDAFAEFKNGSTWAADGRALMYNCIDGQFFNDGTQDEESPGYASDVINDMLDAKQLDKVNGITWVSKYNTKLNAAINALYEQLTPDGLTPAIGDTYPTLQTPLYLKIHIVQGLDLSDPKPRGNDVWLFGISAVDPYIHNSPYPALGTRPNTYALTDSGNYVFRSDSSSTADQINFKDSATGGAHGHFDSLSFELTGGGNTLLADPGPYKYDTSASRAWAISTPAHNTVSLDGKNVGNLTAGTDSFGVDSYDAQSDHVQISAYQDGYAYLSGAPDVSRSVWYNYNGVIVVLDWVNGTASHAATQDWLLPGTGQTYSASGKYIQSVNSSGENVRVQSISQSGQTVSEKTSGIFTSVTSASTSPATQFIVSQSGSFVCFATLITTFSGNTAPSVSATLGTVSKNHSVTVALNINGSTQNLTFTPHVPFVPNSSGTVPGSYSDIGYDSSGNLDMVYYDRNKNDLKFTQRDKSGNWSAVQTIDSGYQCGFDPAIAIDSDNHIGVAYTDANNGDLKYAYFNGTAWSVQSVDVPGSTGHYPSLAFSRHDAAVISYYDKTHCDLKLASQDTDTTWTIQTVDSGSVGTKDVGRFSSLSLDPSRPDATKWAIAYEDTGAGTYKYAIQGTVSGGVHENGYTIFTVSTAPKLGGYVSLAFDSANRPGISWYDSAISGLRYAHSSGSFLEGTAFTATTVTQNGAVGYYSNLYYNGTTPYIYYFDKTHAKVARATFASKKWTVTNLADGGREIHVARHGATVAYTDDNEALGSVSVFFA